SRAGTNEAVSALSRHMLAGALALFACFAVHAERAVAATARERLDQALAAGRIADARAIADSVLDARARRERDRPLAVASYADSLGLQFFMAGTPEALAA